MPSTGMTNAMKRKLTDTKVTAKQRRELKALVARPERRIDTSDIPPLTDAFRKNAQRNPFYRVCKTSTTVRIDADVLAWLKSKGRGYQTRLNHILRDAMLAEVK